MEAIRTFNTTHNVQMGTKTEAKRYGRLTDWMNNPNRVTVVINDMKAVLK